MCKQDEEIKRLAFLAINIYKSDIFVTDEMALSRLNATPNNQQVKFTDIYDIHGSIIIRSSDQAPTFDKLQAREIINSPEDYSSLTLGERLNVMQARAESISDVLDIEPPEIMGFISKNSTAVMRHHTNQILLSFTQPLKSALISKVRSLTAPKLAKSLLGRSVRILTPDLQVLLSPKHSENSLAHELRHKQQWEIAYDRHVNKGYSTSDSFYLYKAHRQYPDLFLGGDATNAFLKCYKTYKASPLEYDADRFAEDITNSKNDSDVSLSIRRP
ncbi:MAG: hypothetical protein FWE31_05275 [Firmicutes bacterium]|nr:hypothetical protein [Bacillota bacterium]